MKVLLVIALTALSAFAAPAFDDQVEIVRPRKVSTGGESAGPTYSLGRPRLSYADILRRLGLSGGFGFTGLYPRDNPSCDSGRFQLSDPDYDVVMTCQRENSDDAGLKQCIINGLSDEGKDLKEFLNRDEYDIAGISSSFSIVIANEEISRKRTVTFRLCPKDEVNAVDTETTDGAADTDTDTAVRPTSDTSLFGGIRPTFQFPDLFSQQNPFLNFGDVFKPFFQNTDGLFPSFSDFPNIGDTDFPTDVDFENCVSESFQLPRDQFKKARDCQYGDTPFQECLRTELGSSEEAKELLRFVESEQHRVVGTSFYSSLSAVNGEVTRKHKIRLQRCLKTEEQAPATPEEGTSAEEPVPASPATPETDQEEASTEAGSELENPPYSTGSRGEVIEP